MGAGHIGTACPARTQISESVKENICSAESMLVYTVEVQGARAISLLKFRFADTSRRRALQAC